MRLPTITIESPARLKPLQSFGWGLGVHFDSGTEPIEPDAPAIALLHDIGVTHYRINVRWNRVAPTASGPIDDAALDRLSEAIDLFLLAGIEPLVALDNAAIPLDLEADGGWRNVATARAYDDFVGAVGARVGDAVIDWLPLSTPRPAPFHPSMSPVLLRAHETSSRILRAHCPFASIGTSVDISQFDTDVDTDEAQGNIAWLEHVTRTPTDFTAMNIDNLALRSPRFVGDAIRLLDATSTTSSFVLTETLSSVSHRREALRVINGSQARPSHPIAELLREIQQLRSEQINVARAFSWPTACTGTVPDDAYTPDAFADYRRMVSIGIN